MKEMSKKCWICKNPEDFFLNQKKNLLKETEEELEKCRLFKEQIVEVTCKKLGFTKTDKDEVRNINDDFLVMTVSAVIENREGFLNLEPRLEKLISYYSKYLSRDKNIKTVSDVLENFLKEPIEDRYSRDLKINTCKETEFFSKKEKLESIGTIFVCKSITPGYIDNMLETEYSKLGFNFPKQIFLCPVCASFLKESANASFQIEQAKLEAERMADDWDDDDEYF